ncbi:unnamed protein product [Eruca vesicaria subsp. sativa]|uniref:Uncharacterized protein n=1 Tax=Eruca vesicaria subsp. sativa TaxID=29727 RepID=A0ABC8K3X2_ERUVS|nr:unnamed protein product [Eruca vesicaria subsp. sativa]
MAQENQSAARFTGKVNWFNDSKGYGFITPDDEGDELFVHQSSIVSEGYRSLAIGDLVEFEITQGTDGKTKAVDVTAPGGAPLKKKETSSRGRSGRGGGGCYNCGEAGHLAKDCTDGGERGACYTCGDTSHLARDCVKKPIGGERGGGVARGGGGARGDGCYNCGDSGHLARDCVKKSVGGERVSGGGGRGDECYTCGGFGHMSRECPSKRQARGGCYECGGAHLARDCEQRGSGGGGGGRSSGGCYECGGAHLARDCDKRGGGGGGRSGGGGRECYKCGEGGHIARECSVA